MILGDEMHLLESPGVATTAVPKEPTLVLVAGGAPADGIGARNALNKPLVGMMRPALVPDEERAPH